jgi:hypothetical protein
LFSEKKIKTEEVPLEQDIQDATRVEGSHLVGSHCMVTGVFVPVSVFQIYGKC